MNDTNNRKTTKSSNSDVLSDVFNLLKLSVDIYHNAKVCGDWRIKEHRLGATCFHIVTLGCCNMSIEGGEPMILNQGDLVIFPRELAHKIVPIEPLIGQQKHLSFAEGRSLSGTGLLCGEALFKHKGRRVLLDQLPRYFIIKYDENNNWLKAIFDLVVYENTHPQSASSSITNRLSELLFTYAIRQHLNDHPEKSGMLNVYSSPQLAKAIQCIHGAPEKNWTIQSLAKQAGFSRTTFAQKFKSISGWTPGQYLVWWRMQIAWSLLNEGELVSQVAEKVGYQSESSFSRAFSKIFAISAGKVRRMRRD